jgi:hypothetical protein
MTDWSPTLRHLGDDQYGHHPAHAQVAGLDVLIRDAFQHGFWRDVSSQPFGHQESGP